MTIQEQLEANYQNGYYSILQNGFGEVAIVSTKSNYDFRFSSFCMNLEIAKINTGIYPLLVAKLENPKIIGTIHPSELMGPGMKPGQKVRVKENAKEECEKYEIGWIDYMQKMIGNGCELYGKSGLNYKVFTPDKCSWWTFPPAALEPVYEDDEKIEWLEKGKKEGWVKDGNVVV